MRSTMTATDRIADEYEYWEDLDVSTVRHFRLDRCSSLPHPRRVGVCSPGPDRGLALSRGC